MGSRLQALTCFYLFSILFAFQAQSSVNSCRGIFSSPPVSQVLIQGMRDMRSEEVYEKDFCNTNICSLLLFVEGKEINLSKAEVLYLLPFGESTLLFPLKTPVKVASWDLHVVLRYQDRIYDFDFAGGVLPLSRYMKEMFDVDSKNDQGIEVRIIPALDYMRDYVDHRSFSHGSEFRKDFYYYGYDVNPYPLVPLKTLVRD